MNRRDFIMAGVGAACAYVAIPRIAHGTAAQPAPSTGCPPPPPGPAMFCIADTARLDSGYYAYVAALESELGRKFAGIRINYGPDNYPALSPDIVRSIDLGRTWIYQNGKPDPLLPDTDTSGTYWRRIADGAYDDIYLMFWRDVQASGLFTQSDPLYYSPQHEQTSLSEPPAAAGAGTPADWIAAFRHIHDICVAYGYHISAGGCIALCFVPDLNQVIHDPVYGSGTPPAAVAAYQLSLMDPGAAYYDRCGMDCYLKATTSFTANEALTPLHRWATAVGKPWMLGEFGLDASKDVAGFLASMTSLIDQWGAGTDAGQCSAVCCTSRIAKGGDYRMDATPETLAAWSAFGTSGIFS
jgi:hypothetical protein